MSGHFSVLGLAVLGVTITTAHVLRFSIFSAFPPTLDEASQGRPLPSELPGGCTAEFAPSSDNGAPTGLFLFSVLGTACLLVGWKAGRDAEQRKGQTAGHGSVALPPRAPGAVPALSCSGPPGCGLGLASGEHWHVTGGDRRGRRGQGEDGWAASALHHASPPPPPLLLHLGVFPVVPGHRVPRLRLPRRTCRRLSSLSPPRPQESQRLLALPGVGD